MTKLYHQKNPVLIKPEHCYIGKDPSSTYFGDPLLSSFQYLQNWSQTGQIFTYSGPPDDTMNDSPGTAKATGYIEGNFYVVLGGVVKNDAGTARMLGGALLPWKYNAWWDSVANDWDNEVSVTWTEAGGSPSNIFTKYGSSPNYSSMAYHKSLDSKILPWDLSTGDFYYSPTTDYTWGEIKTKGIQTAALGVWTMPDVELTGTQTIFKTSGGHAYMAPGRAIRGYSGSGEPSLGDMIHRIGDTTRSDSLIWNTQRCLFQWGHPVGVFTDSNSYNTLGTSARYPVWPQNFREQPNTQTITVHPNIVATSTNALVGDQAYVKISSYDSTPTLIDTWEVSFYDNTTNLYKYSDGTGSDGLDINAHDVSWLKIEVKAPDNSGTGELVLHTVSLWQPPEW